ncbi:MAG: PAS domain S-box protein [Halodesulfurarchaeum sp.]
MAPAAGKPGDTTVVYVSGDTGQAEQFATEIERQTGLSVHTRSTVDGGLESLATVPDVACIVSDYDLPDIDGLAFLQTVRAQFPDLPFILFTSEGTERVASRAIAARVTDYLIKERFQDQWAELGALIERSIEADRSNRSLADPDARAKNILEACLDPMAIVREDGFVYANRNALELFEVDEFAAFDGSTVADVIAPDSAAITTETIRRIQAGEKRIDRLEQEVLGREGARTPVELTAASIEWNGAPSILLIFRDVAERRARIQELRRFKRAVEAAGHAIYVTDVDGTIEYVNPAFETITGFSEGEAVGENPRLLNSGEMSTAYFETLWNTISAGEIWEESVVNRRKNGELYHANQTIAPITDREGAIQSFVAIQTDISEQVALREQLAAAKERYESLFKSIRDAILVADTDRRIIDCNPGFTDLFGYELADIQGKSTEYVYASGAEYEEMGEAIREHVGDPQFTHTVTCEKQSGQTFPGETNVFHLRNAENEIVGFIGIIRDVSGRQDRLHQLWMIDRILQHNFNNEMTVIGGNAELIRENGAENLAGYADRIVETADRLSATVEKERLITEFLSDPPEVEPIGIGEVVKKAVGRVTRDHPEADIVTTGPEGTMIRGSVAMEDAITELLTNAVMYSRADHPRATVKSHIDGDTVHIEVRDENPPIPGMERKVLTGEHELNPLYHGSGLGLWLVTLIVEHVNGHVEFEENEPRGNVVRLVFERVGGE